MALIDNCSVNTSPAAMKARLDWPFSVRGLKMYQPQA